MLTVLPVFEAKIPVVKLKILNSFSGLPVRNYGKRKEKINVFFHIIIQSWPEYGATWKN